jgi:hypothetical protein
VKGQKIFTVSVASKPIPQKFLLKFLLAASDPTSLASAKTGLTAMTATATLAEMNYCAATNSQGLGTARISQMHRCGNHVSLKRGRTI